MTPIPNSFTKYGYCFNLIRRSPKAAVYAQMRGDKLHAYEVHRLRIRKAGVFHGKPTSPSERLAGENEWGVMGRTYTASIVGHVGARKAADVQFIRWSRVAA